MKLYATVASERATKGQGGNEYLKIILTVGSAKNAIDFGTLILDQREDEDGNDGAFVLTYNEEEIASYNPNEEKGEKQKGECNHACITSHENMETCDKCGYTATMID